MKISQSPSSACVPESYFWAEDRPKIDHYATVHVFAGGPHAPYGSFIRNRPRGLESNLEQSRSLGRKRKAY